MRHSTFFPLDGSLNLGELSVLAGVPVPTGLDPAMPITDVSRLDAARPGDLVYADKPKLKADVAGLPAGVVLLCTPDLVEAAAQGVVVVACKNPALPFHFATARLYPAAIISVPTSGHVAHADGSWRHPDCLLEDGVTLAPGVVIGAGTEIGRGTVIGPNSVIGDLCKVGRNCRIAANVGIEHALIGDGVAVHPGVRIGQDGFGYVPGPKGLIKVPQLGRVIIQNDVEIGANTTIDRGALRDTVIGEGTKIDNLVQIAHNVQIGRHCIIVAQVGIAGSTTVGDGTVIGGAAGIKDHLTIGRGVMLAARSGLMHDIPDGGRWAGYPARPAREHFREISALSELANRRRKRDE